MAYRDAVLADSPLHFWELQDGPVPAPAIVQQATYVPTSSGTAHNITLGATPTAGNYLLLMVYTVGTGPTVTPGGAAWTNARNVNLGAATGWLRSFSRAVSGDTATIAVTLSTAGLPILVLYELSGVDLTAPIANDSGANATTVITVQPPRENSLLFYWTGGLEPTAYTLASGWTEDAEIATTAPVTVGRLVVGHRLVFNPDPTVTGDATGSPVASSPGGILIPIQGALPAATDTGSSASNAPGTYKTGNAANTQISLGRSGPNRTDKAMALDVGTPYVTYMEVPDQTDLDILGDLTIEAWVRYDDTSSTTYILTKGENGAANVPFYFAIVNSRTLVYFSGNASGGLTRLGTTGTIPLGAWTHVAVTRSGTTLTFYVNGVSQAASGAATIPTVNAVNVLVGKVPSTQLNAPGGIAYVALWASALTGTQIATHYAAHVSLGGVVTQAAVEVLANPSSTARVTQAAVEVLTAPASTVRVTQAAAEVLTNSPTGITTYYDYILAEGGLVGYWPLNEASGNAVDRTGNHNDAAPSGTWLYQNAYFGPDNRAAVRANGANASFDDTTVTGLPSGNSPWTFELWFQVPSTYSTSNYVPFFTIG